jgi:hypothetical protein
MGLLVSGLLIIVATVIFISMSGKPYREDGIFVGDEQTQMELMQKELQEKLKI